MEDEIRSDKSKNPPVIIRTLTEKDLPDADRIFRLAFGTWHGLPEPLNFGGDANFCRTRWFIDPSATFAAEVNGELVGSNFAATWGSVGFFGPLTVRPDLWDQGIAQRLLSPTMELFSHRNVSHAGFFTNPDSPKHISLYQKFGFRPRFLTAIMSAPVKPKGFSSYTTRYSDAKGSERTEILNACRELGNSIFEGLDLEIEIVASTVHGFGDTVLLWDNSKLAGFSVCHCGAGTEAGSDVCYIKFGAVRPGSDAAGNFDHLLDACEALAAEKRLPRLVGGMSTARYQAYEQMLKRGFRINMLGISMHRPNEPGYNRPEVFVIDDWR
jgi:ribosomal protein S18 acetylase RimI-like enzyme